MCLATCVAQVTTRLREMQSSFQEGSAGRVLETIASDVNSLRSQVRGVRGGRDGVGVGSGIWRGWGFGRKSRRRMQTA